MGTKYTFKCSKCGYEVLTSAGNDYGMRAVIDTYICESCQNVVDVCVGEYGQTYSKEEIIHHKNESAMDIKFFVCPACGSGEQLLKWNKNKRPCPKCQGKMGKDSNGIIVLWD